MASCTYEFRRQQYSSEEAANRAIAESEIPAKPIFSNSPIDTYEKKVYDRSQTYDNIASLPLLTEEESLLSYAYTLTEEFNKKFGQDAALTIPNLSKRELKAAGILFNSLPNAQVMFASEGGGLTPDRTQSIINSPVYIVGEDGTVLNTQKHLTVLEETGEPKIFYRSAIGNIFDTLMDALRDSETGAVTIGAVSPLNKGVKLEGNQLMGVPASGFIPITTFSADSSTNSVEGFINDAIIDGSLADHKEFDGQQWRYVGYGQTPSEQLANANLVLLRATMTIGSEYVTMDKDGYLDFHDINPSEVTYTMEDGSEGTFNMDELIQWSEQGILKKKLKGVANQEAIMYMVYRMSHDIYDVDENTQTANAMPAARPESELRILLLNTLNTLGIKVTSIADYVKNYNNRFDGDPSVTALADLTNKVVALAEGKFSDEDIAEELSHFVIEAYDNQEAIKELYEEVETTDEWITFSSTYYHTYGQKFEGDVLEELVHKEILGKILARKVVEKFARVQGETQSTGFFATLRQIWNNFISKIQARFTPQTRDKMDSLLDEIAESIVNQRTAERYMESYIGGTDAVMYSQANARVQDAMLKAMDIMDLRLQTLKYQNSPLVTTIQRIKSKAKTELDFLTGAAENIYASEYNKREVAALMTFVDFVDRIITPLHAVWGNRANLEGLRLSYEDSILIESIDRDYVPLLNEIKELLKDIKFGRALERAAITKYIDIIESLVDKAAPLTANMKKVGEQQYEIFNNQMMKDLDLDEESRKKIEELEEKEVKDVNILTEKFGFMEHANNRYIRMLGVIINKNAYEARNQLQRLSKKFLEMVSDSGWLASDFRRLRKMNPDGTLSRFLRSMDNLPWFYEEKLKNQYEAYKAATQEELTLKQYETALKTPNHTYMGADNKTKKLIGVEQFTEEQLDLYNKMIDDWRVENTELFYTKEFYRERDKMFDEIKVGGGQLSVDGEIKTIEGRAIRRDTMEFLKSLSQRRYAILNKYKTTDETGQIYYTLNDMSVNDRNELAQLRIERRRAKEIIDPVTNLKKIGIEWDIAQDLQAIDKMYRDREEKQGKVKGGIQSRFWQYMEEYAAKLKADGLTRANINKRLWDALHMNGGVTFRESYWDALSQGQTPFTDKLEELIMDGTIQDNTTKDNIAVLKDLYARRATILKRYHDPTNPAETLVDAMPSQEIVALKEVEDAIHDLYLELTAIVANQIGQGETAQLQRISETSVNEAYKAALKASSKNEVEFLREHMSTSNAATFTKVSDNIKKIVTGKTDRVTRSLSLYIMSKYGVEEDEVLGTIKNILDPGVLLVEYGRTKVLPYFKRHAPQGYTQFLEQLATESETNQGMTIVEQLIATNKAMSQPGYVPSTNPKITDLIEIVPDYSWLEETDEKNINPNYVHNYEGGMLQPSIKYRDDQFVKEFDIDVDQYLKTGKVVSKTNSPDFKMWESLVDMRRQAIKLYKDEGRLNVYELPGIGMSVLERAANITDSFTDVTANSIRDFAQNRIDELAYGEVAAVSSDGKEEVRVIPKMFTHRLEEDSDYSDEMARTYTMFLQAAINHSERHKTIGDALALQQQVANQRFVGGKNGRDSNSYKMFKEFVDSYFFGIKRARKLSYQIGNTTIDFAKIFQFFDEKIVRFANIAASPAIALTSFTTGELSLRIEGWVGEHIHAKSINWADREFLRLMPEYISEAGTISRNNKMYLMAEKFGLVDPLNKVENSGYGRALRISKQPMYLGLKLGDIPLMGRVMLSTLDDFRMVKVQREEGGEMVDRYKIYSYNDFITRPESVGKTNKELNAEWETYQQDSVYNMLEVTDKEVLIKQKYRDLMGDDYVETKVRQIQNKVITLKGNVDAVVTQDDRMAASRDYILNFATAHRGWFFINSQRALKSEQFNYRTMQFEKGWIISYKDFLWNTFRSMRRDDLNLIKHAAENWDKLTIADKKNVYRAGIHTSVWFASAIIGSWLAGFIDDDDDDPRMMQYAAYVWFRTVNEIGSVHPIWGATGAIDVLKTPFIAINSLSQINFNNLSLREVQSGAYKGHSKLYQTIVKQTILRHYYDYIGIEKKSRYYRLLNDGTLLWAGVKAQEKEDETEGKTNKVTKWVRSAREVEPTVFEWKDYVY